MSWNFLSFNSHNKASEQLSAPSSGWELRPGEGTQSSRLGNKKTWFQTFTLTSMPLTCHWILWASVFSRIKWERNAISSVFVRIKAVCVLERAVLVPCYHKTVSVKCSLPQNFQEFSLEILKQGIFLHIPDCPVSYMGLWKHKLTFWIQWVVSGRRWHCSSSEEGLLSLSCANCDKDSGESNFGQFSISELEDNHIYRNSEVPVPTFIWTILLWMTILGTSLVAQWLRICPPKHGTQVRALVQKDPTCHGATKPVCHNSWACALEPMSHNYWACVPQLLSPCATTTEACAPKAHAPQREATAMRRPCTATKSSHHSPQLGKAHVQQWRPNTAKNK